MSPSLLDSLDLFEWCRIRVTELENHPDRKVAIKVLKTPDDVHRWVAQDMVDEVKRNNKAGKPTHWILPCGPTTIEYPVTFIQDHPDAMIIIDELTANPPLG